MCGIAGLFLSNHIETLSVKNNPNKVIIDDCLKALKHRGPDFQKFVNSDDLIIGHNLLQIRGELNDSKQPKYSKH